MGPNYIAGQFEPCQYDAYRTEFLMTLVEIITFAIVASLLVMTPGPNGMLIAKTVPTSGRGAGFANVAGFVCAFYLHGALSILGISILLVQSATAFAIVKYLGAAYLIWIGLKALYAALQNEALDQPTPQRHRRNLLAAFGEGFLTNALNPKVSMFYLAAFPQFISVGETTATSAFLLVFLHSIINLIWFGAMVLLFSRLTKIARSGRFQRWLKATTGVVFVAFGVKLATFRPDL
jgi:threonine/homoserine/homoserine lactone efflux protein